MNQFVIIEFFVSFIACRGCIRTSGGMVFDLAPAKAKIAQVACGTNFHVLNARPLLQFLQGSKGFVKRGIVDMSKTIMKFVAGINCAVGVYAHGQAKTAIP